MAKNIEQECKWDATTRGTFKRFLEVLSQVGARVKKGKQLCITDCYLDDKKQRLSAQKVALRVRRYGGRVEATLKSRCRLQNGLAVRKEFTWPLPQVRTSRGGIKQLAVRGVWEGICLKNLQVRFVIRNNRQLYLVQYGECQCELALDNYLTLAGGHQMRRKEIELELKKGKQKDFIKLIEKIAACGCIKTAKTSKVAGAEKWISNKFRRN